MRSALQGSSGGGGTDGRFVAFGDRRLPERHAQGGTGSSSAHRPSFGTYDGLGYIGSFIAGFAEIADKRPPMW
jgi:hypothetical protein